MTYTAKIRGEISVINPGLSWEQIGMLATFGMKELDLAAHASAKWHTDYLVNEASLDPEDYIDCQKCSTPEGVRLMDGEGLLLHARLTEEDDENAAPAWESVEKILHGHDAVCVLYAYALYRVDNALSSQIAGDMDGALGCLAMAGDVMIMASEATARESGIRWERMHTAVAMRNAARKRHVETYELRAEAIAHWSAQIDRNLSGQKAGAILSKIFPLSQRKLSEYVMAEKKRLLASMT
ncbi:hypothetical protein C7C56_003650 [Massilia glaciei]|uniref:Uncharacterized protein n=2 Tax=Massilia glaciei TaxID=1524097 RepID=A0A2U2I5Q6_9BURK|nr:hypothetical protein C7C56_003650 [Massilia glaciei]